MSSGVVSDMVDDSSIVDVAFMDSWHVFMFGIRESGCILLLPHNKIDKGVHCQKDRHICSNLF
jgi:hypothetical protein